jgi:hypothetical protein
MTVPLASLASLLPLSPPLSFAVFASSGPGISPQGPVVVSLVALLLGLRELGRVLHSSRSGTCVRKFRPRALTVREQPLRGLSTTSSPVSIQCIGVVLAGLPHRAGCTYPKSLGDQQFLVLTSNFFRVTQFEQVSRQSIARGFVPPLFVLDTSPLQGGSVDVSSTSHSVSYLGASWRTLKLTPWGSWLRSHCLR